MREQDGHGSGAVSVSARALTEEGVKAASEGSGHWLPAVPPSAETTWEEQDTAYVEEMWGQLCTPLQRGVSLPWQQGQHAAAAGPVLRHPGGERLGTRKRRTGLGVIGGSVARTATEPLPLELLRSHLHKQEPDRASVGTKLAT